MNKEFTSGNARRRLYALCKLNYTPNTLQSHVGPENAPALSNNIYIEKHLPLV